VKEAGLAELWTLIAALRRSVAAPARLYLVSRTSHLAEGWRDRVPALELAGDAGGAELGEAVREAARALGVDSWESPADGSRCRQVEERSLPKPAKAPAREDRTGWD
jgi:hypothetical protein